MNPVYERLTDLATCLCAEIQASDGPDVCFCGLTPGEGAIGLYAGDCSDKCGMAWVRLVAAYPATGVGTLSENAGNCGASIGFDVEMGIMRCIDVGDEQGNPPPPPVLLAATELQLDDMLIMERALICCDSINTKDVILGTYAPLGPDGGLIGGTWTMKMVVP